MSGSRGRLYALAAVGVEGPVSHPIGPSVRAGTRRWRACQCRPAPRARESSLTTFAVLFTLRWRCCSPRLRRASAAARSGRPTCGSSASCGGASSGYRSDRYAIVSWNHSAWCVASAPMTPHCMICRKSSSRASSNGVGVATSWKRRLRCLAMSLRECDDFVMHTKYNRSGLAPSRACAAVYVGHCRQLERQNGSHARRTRCYAPRHPIADAGIREVQKTETPTDQWPLPGFRPAAFQFFRELKRNNRREWFEARREIYETEVRGPLRELLEELDVRLATLAPELVADPKAVGLSDSSRHPVFQGQIAVQDQRGVLDQSSRAGPVGGGRRPRWSRPVLPLRARARR